MTQTRRQAEIELWERIGVERGLRRKRLEKELKEINETRTFLAVTGLILISATVITGIVALLIKFL